MFPNVTFVLYTEKSRSDRHLGVHINDCLRRWSYQVHTAQDTFRRKGVGAIRKQLRTSGNIILLGTDAAVMDQMVWDCVEIIADIQKREPPRVEARNVILCHQMSPAYGSDIWGEVSPSYVFPFRDKYDITEDLYNIFSQNTSHAICRWSGRA